jgi:undecaprenyl-diphosphatase
VVFGLLAALAAAAGWTLRENFRTVVPGQVYRSGQLGAAALEGRVAQCHLRAVLNLRGANPQEDWYREECAAADALGLHHYDLATDSVLPPNPEELRELIRVLDRCERPLLIHCNSGIDRTGVVAAICILLGEGGSVADAEGQFSLTYGALPWRPSTTNGREFVALYEHWLAGHGLGHSASHFRQWATSVYSTPSDLAQGSRGPTPLP